MFGRLANVGANKYSKLSRLKKLTEIVNRKLFLQFVQEMSTLVNYILKKLREDQVQMADYALKSAGE